MTVKKLFVAAMFVTISAVSLYAQDVQLATLQQGEDLRVFYGADALKDAVNAAEDGNTIYLSAGEFSSYQLQLSKSIKIIGAGGFNTDASKNTVIIGEIEIKRPAESYIDYLELEGFVTIISIGGNSKMLKVKKIKSEGIYFQSSVGDFFNIELI